MQRIRHLRLVKGQASPTHKGSNIADSQRIRRLLVAKDQASLLARIDIAGSQKVRHLLLPKDQASPTCKGSDISDSQRVRRAKLVNGQISSTGKGLDIFCSHNESLAFIISYFHTIRHLLLAKGQTSSTRKGSNTRLTKGQISHARLGLDSFPLA